MAGGYYDLDEIKRLLSEGNWEIGNDRVYNELDKLSWSEGELFDCLMGLNPADFDKSIAQRRCNRLGVDLDSDQYSLCWHLDEWRRATPQERQAASMSVMEFSIKVAIRDVECVAEANAKSGDDGDCGAQATVRTLVSVTFHPSMAL